MFTLLSACDVVEDRIMLLLPDNPEREKEKRRVVKNFLLRKIWERKIVALNQDDGEIKYERDGF